METRLQFPVSKSLPPDQPRARQIHPTVAFIRRQLMRDQRETSFLTPRLAGGPMLCPRRPVTCDPRFILRPKDRMRESSVSRPTCSNVCANLDEPVSHARNEVLENIANEYVHNEIR